MAGVNKVFLVGRLGRDPEIRYSQDGRGICNFSVATSNEWKDKNTGEKKERTEWSRIVAFGKLAEICGQYLSKGRQVYVEGKLQTRQWEKEGVTMYTTEIVASEVQFLGDRGEAQPRQHETQQQTPADAQARALQHVQSEFPGATVVGSEDDVPF